MAERYNIQYFSVSNDEYEISIRKPSYAGASESVTGTGFYSINNLEDISKPVKAKQLTIELLATEIASFQDLLDSEEREWEVYFYRNSELLFFGYITSENVTQDYHRKERYIEFEVLDPLAFLEDLSYVQDDGNSWVGNASLIQILTRCVNRGFSSGSTKFNFITYVPYDFRKYDVVGETNTFDTSGDFLTQIALDQDQWVDEGEVESCLTILKDFLFSLELQIFQVNGNTWMISPYLYDVSSLSSTYIHYFDPDASEISSFGSLPFSNVQIETDDGANKQSLLHCNENQQFYYKRALQELRLENPYVARSEIIENGIFENGVNGGAMPNWTLDADYAESTDQGHLIIKRFNSSIDTDSFAAESDTLVVASKGNFLKLVGTLRTNITNNITVFQYNLILESPQLAQSPYILDNVYAGGYDPNNTYFGWSPTSLGSTKERQVIFEQDDETEFLSFEVEIPEIPADYSKIKLVVYAVNVRAGANYDPSHEIELLDIDLISSDSSNSGIAYVTKNTDQLSLKSEKEESVFNTRPENINSSTLISINELDPIDGIKNILYNNNYRELAEDLAITLIKSKRKRIIFQGDVYGFFDFHKYVQLLDLSLNRFSCIEYTFDSYRNVISMKLEEVLDGSINITQETEDIFKNVIDPTIKT